MVPELETERLWLLNWKTSDAPALYAYASDPEVGPNAGWQPHTSVWYSRSIIRTVFRPNKTWKITWKETMQPIGTIGLEPDRRRPDADSMELGYSLDRHFWGRGIMSEAVDRVLRYAFDERQLAMVCVCTGTKNERSRRVIEKAGFVFEGVERRSFRVYDGSFIDERVYSLLRPEWHALLRGNEVPRRVPQLDE